MRKRWLIAALALCAVLVLALPTAANARLRPLFAAMSGANEITDNGMRGVGDPDGGGSFTAVIDGRKLCYGIAVKDIEDPIAAHIHKGGKNKNGPDRDPAEAPDERRSGLLQRLRAAQPQAVTGDSQAPGQVLREHPQRRLPGRSGPGAALRQKPLARIRPVDRRRDSGRARIRCPPAETSFLGCHHGDPHFLARAVG